MGREIRFPAGLFETGDRDEQANREVAAILAGLSGNHLARRAFARGRTTIDITNHLRDRRELFHKVMNVSWDQYRRKASRAARNRR